MRKLLLIVSIAIMFLYACGGGKLTRPINSGSSSNDSTSSTDNPDDSNTTNPDDDNNGEDNGDNGGTTNPDGGNGGSGSNGGDNGNNGSGNNGGSEVQPPENVTRPLELYTMETPKGPQEVSDTLIVTGVNGFDYGNNSLKFRVHGKDVTYLCSTGSYSSLKFTVKSITGVAPYDFERNSVVTKFIDYNGRRVDLRSVSLPNNTFDFSLERNMQSVQEIVTVTMKGRRELAAALQPHINVYKSASVIKIELEATSTKSIPKANITPKTIVLYAVVRMP